MLLLHTLSRASGSRTRLFVGLLLGCVTLASGNACQEHVLQTASLGSSTPGEGGAEGLTCSEETNGTQAEGAIWGEGVPRESWEFATGKYSVSQGPGIAVAARDAFRLFVNGVLLHESEGAREPVFVPVLLPPGDNVIALAVTADSGTPAALIHIDELERAIESDRSWRYSQSPEGAWTEVGFDDGSWRTATELADLGDVPGCDPESNFPSNSEARWIGPPLGTTGSVGLRTTVKIAPIGFGEGTTGGDGAKPVVLSDWEELRLLAESNDPKVILLAEGAHDFRRKGDAITDQEVCPSECPDDASKVLYRVLIEDETCPVALTTMPRNDQTLRLGSNTTLLGLGRGAALRGVTLDLQENENIIVRNIAVYDVNPGLIEAGDAFTLNQPTRVWIDHATTAWISDGFADLRAGTSKVTLSYMHFSGRTDYECDGAHSRTSSITDSELTIHHSRFDHLRQNAPMASGRESRIHLFNNAYSNVSGWAIASICEAVVRVEGCTFENVEAIGVVSNCGADTPLGYLNFPSGSNLYRDGTPVFIGGDGSEPQESHFSPPYKYELEQANDAWPLVVSRAGAGGPWALPLSLD